MIIIIIIHVILDNWQQTYVHTESKEEESERIRL